MKRFYAVVMLFFAFLTAVACPNAVSASLTTKKIQTICEGETLKPLKLYSFSSDDYFAVRDLAQVYGSHLVYQPVSGKVALLMNNRRLDIFVKSTKVLYDNKKKRLSIPTRYVKGEVYVPATLILTPDFAAFSETVSSLNAEAGILTIEKKTNVLPPRYYSKANKTQIVIEMQEDLSYDWLQKSTDSVVISFLRGRMHEQKMDVNDGVVKSFSLDNRGRSGVVTIQLAAGAGIVTKKHLSQPSRLVIDIERKADAAPAAPAEVAVAASSAPAVNTSTDTASASASASLAVPAALPAAAVPVVTPAVAATSAKKKLIILDAGHGGDDPGAIGPNGTKEKEINLAIVYELKRLFEEDGEYEVALSRKDDTFIPLVERTSFANDRKADLFVSVHCNANMSRSMSGFEIYFLNEKASDPDAAATAILENSVVRLEAKPNKSRAMLQELLWSMAKNEFINESSELCSFIGSEVTHRTKIENRGVKQAGFFVLRGAQMPAVLCECAFLSNYAEETKLKSKQFRSYVADSIYEGIKKYYLRRDSVNAKR